MGYTLVFGSNSILLMSGCNSVRISKKFSGQASGVHNPLSPMTYPYVVAIYSEVDVFHKAGDAFAEPDSLKAWSFGYVIKVYATVLRSNGKIT